MKQDKKDFARFEGKLLIAILRNVYYSASTKIKFSQTLAFSFAIAGREY